MSFLLFTCSYNDPGLPRSRNVRDGFVEVLHMGFAKAPLCNWALWATSPLSACSAEALLQEWDQT